MVDVVSKIYIQKMRLVEMTLRIPDIRGTILTDYDTEDYKSNRDQFKFHKTESGHDLGNFRYNNRNLYVTFDGADPIHAAHIDSYPSGAHGLPFSHDVQSIVNRDQNSKYSGVAREAMHYHVENSGIPLVTDGGQSKAGHSMWKKFAKESLAIGNHVYLWDGKKLDKSNSDNIDHHLDTYYGDDKHSHRMVVSKKELNA